MARRDNQNQASHRDDNNVVRDEFIASETDATVMRSLSLANSTSAASKPSTMTSVDDYAFLPASTRSSHSIASDNVYATAEDLPPAAHYQTTNEMAPPSQNDNEYGQIDPLPVLAEYRLS